MTVQRMDHVGIVVDDLAAAIEFFVELGLELQGEGPVEGRWADLGRDDLDGPSRRAPWGRVNALRPFREGNGRAQRAFFAQLAGDAGYSIVEPLQ